MAKVMKAPGKYIQAAGELKNIGTHVKNMGTKFLVIISKRNQAEHGEEIKTSLEEAGYECVFETFGGECSLEEIDRLMKIGKEAECNSVIAVGGGKAIDTGKAVAVRLDVTVIVVPTIASNDAPCSGPFRCIQRSGCGLQSYLWKEKSRCGYRRYRHHRKLPGTSLRIRHGRCSFYLF